MSDSHEFDARFIEPGPGQGLDEAAFAPGPEQRDAPHDDLSAEIAAEIADHLAESAALARTQGRTDEEAHALAANRFGDTAAILRQCWWIKKGDTIMFRSAAIALLSICVIGLFAVAYSAWRIEASFADQMSGLSTQLAELTETQRELLDRPDATPEITGLLYLGETSRPAANVEVEIWNAAEMKVIRRVQTDSQGHYATGPLTPGDYFVFAPLQGMRNEIRKPSAIRKTDATHSTYCAQSEVLTIVAGHSPVTCDIDVLMQSGSLSIEIIGNWPQRLLDGKATALVSCEFRNGVRFSQLPWSSEQSLPTDFPLRGEMPSGMPYDRGLVYSGRTSITLDAERGSEFPVTPWSFEDRIPAGRHEIAVRPGLASSKWPHFEKITEEDNVELKPLMALSIRLPLMSEEIFNMTSGGRTAIALQSTSNSDESPAFIPPPTITFEIRHNQRTKLRLIVPDGYEAALNEAIAGFADPDSDKNAIVEKLAQLPLRLELAGYEPIAERESGSEAGKDAAVE